MICYCGRDGICRAVKRVLCAGSDSYIFMCMSMHGYVCVCKYVSVCVSMYLVCSCACLCACVCIYICVCVCMCVCSAYVCVHTCVYMRGGDGTGGHRTLFISKSTVKGEISTQTQKNAKMENKPN
jgi:hypothetical protein